MKRLRQYFAALVTVFSLFLTGTAQAGLSTDLHSLNTQATELQTYLQGVTLSAGNLCVPLNQANSLTRDMIVAIETVTDGLVAPLLTDEAVYDALDELFSISMSNADQALRLSIELQTLSTTTAMVNIKDAIDAMLQLSNDIGTMADRIGEMADKILVMSGNIGLMADRILVTQQLQSDNFAFTNDTILQTQTNVLTVVSMIEDSTYNLSFDDLIAEAGLLATRMNEVVLSPWTMDTQLQAVVVDVGAFLDEVQVLRDTIADDSRDNTSYLSYDALIRLDNLSQMVTPLAAAVDGYAATINDLQSMASTPTLGDAVGSTLLLSGNIGVLADLILEMADQILVMADNIGLVADQILLTQELMSMNAAITQTSILGAQEIAIRLIAARSL